MVHYVFGDVLPTVSQVAWLGPAGLRGVSKFPGPWTPSLKPLASPVELSGIAGFLHPSC